MHAFQLLNKNLRVIICALIVSLFISSENCEAFGLDEIYSPNVEYREFSLELSNARSYDASPVKNNAQVGELTVEIGVTPRLQVEASSEYSKDPGNSLQLISQEIEGRYQFVESGEYWLDIGMLLAYDFSTQGNTLNSMECKVLLQKDSGKLTNTTNIGFTRNVGLFTEQSGNQDYVFLWNTRYRYNIYFQPGIEIQSDLGQVHQLGYINEQEHYFGPSVYGKLFGHLKYQAGYYLGISNVASRSASRLMVEYEMHY
jgi:hypothetical protein